MTELEFTPIGDRIIVKPLLDEEITTSFGIVIAARDEVNKELPQCGEVMAVGEGKTFPDCPNPQEVFSVGDFVYFSRYAGEEIVIGNSLDPKENQKYTVLRLDAVFGKLAPAAAQKMIAERKAREELAKGKPQIQVEDVDAPTKELTKDEVGKLLLDNR
jgi:co-chaperonin GroES (HSP10)